MAERYTRDEVLSMVICDDDDDYIMKHFEPGSDDELRFNSDDEELK